MKEKRNINIHKAPIIVMDIEKKIKETPPVRGKKGKHTRTGMLHTERQEHLNFSVTYLHQ